MSRNDRLGSNGRTGTNLLNPPPRQDPKITTSYRALQPWLQKSKQLQTLSQYPAAAAITQGVPVAQGAKELAQAPGGTRTHPHTLSEP